MFKNCKIVGMDVNPKDYHANKAQVPLGDPTFTVSPSFLREFMICPARMKAGYEPPQSEAKEWGSLVDTLLLTPQMFDSTYVLRPETYPAEKGGEKPWSGNSNWCKAWKEAAQARGMEIVTQQDLHEAQQAKAVFMTDSILEDFHKASDKQVMVHGQWYDEATELSVPVCCLIDYAPKKESEWKNCLGDFKTTRSAHPLAWRKWSSQRGYHLQGAFDLDLYNAATGEDRTTWSFLIQENYAPWQTAREILSQRKLELGRVIYQNALAVYCQALRWGVWPNYEQMVSPNIEVVQGWTVDDVTQWETMNSIPQIEDPPPFENKNFTSETPS